MTCPLCRNEVTWDRTDEFFYYLGFYGPDPERMVRVRAQAATCQSCGENFLHGDFALAPT
jgi:hypothetical protein